MCARMCVNACMCAFVSLCACAHGCACVHMCACGMPCACTCVFVHTCVCMSVCVFAHTCVHLFACACACVHVCICACVCLHMCVHVCVHVQEQGGRREPRKSGRSHLPPFAVCCTRITRIASPYGAFSSPFVLTSWGWCPGSHQLAPAVTVATKRRWTFRKRTRSFLKHVGI